IPGTGGARKIRFVRRDKGKGRAIASLPSTLATISWSSSSTSLPREKKINLTKAEQKALRRSLRADGGWCTLRPLIEILPGEAGERWREGCPNPHTMDAGQELRRSLWMCRPGYHYLVERPDKGTQELYICDTGVRASTIWH